MLFCNTILLWTTAKLYRMHNFHCCLPQLTTPVPIFQINLLEEMPPPNFLSLGLWNYIIFQKCLSIHGVAVFLVLKINDEILKF